MISLGIDTSNYATSLAVVNTCGGEVVCAVKQLLPVKKGELGLRQSDAVFHHTAALPGLLKRLAEGVDLQSVESVGVSTRPRNAEGSYMPCFLAGASFASAFAGAKGLKPYPTSHQEGHIAAARYGAGNPGLMHGKALLFHFSGGTTELLLCDEYTVSKTIGRSLDLYAGQAVDRLGVKLGMHFPAGAALSQLAMENAEEMRPKISLKGCDCHLSGLQNQCERLLEQGKDAAYAARYCLIAIADTALAMAYAARQEYPSLPIICAGGVMSSEVIRTHMCSRMENIWFVPPELSGDNAVGVAWIAGKEGANG